MTSISGVSFDEAWQSRIYAKLDGTEVALIGREALLKNKLASGRPKDLIDVDQLTRKAPKQPS